MNKIQGKRVLLIGSDLAEQAELKWALRAKSFEVEVTTRGDEGLAMALMRAVDVVASDIRMPVVSGLELLERLRLATPIRP